MMKLSAMIRQGLEKKGFLSLKDASAFVGVSSELLRIIINKGYIPKDKSLIIIAKKLGLDPTVLVFNAHREKVPAELKGFFLSPSQSKKWYKKRIFPLSEEQCDYLLKIMSSEEMQMLRKFRQVTEEAKMQIMGYVDYVFALKRKDDRKFHL